MVDRGGKLRLLEGAVATLVVLIMGLSLSRVLPTFGNVKNQLGLYYYYNAAVELNRGASIYASALETHTLYGFIYPPFSAVLFRPLALTSYNAAGTIWVITNMVALILAVYLLCVVNQIKGVLPVAIAIAVAFLFPPAHITIVAGDITVILLLLLVLSRYSMQSGRYGKVLPGVFVGIAAGIKLYPLLLIMAFVINKRFFNVLSALASFVGTLIIGFLLSAVPSDTYTFFTQVLPELAGRQKGYPADQNIQSVMARFFTEINIDVPVFSLENIKAISIKPIVNSPLLGDAIGLLLSALLFVITAAVLWRRGQDAPQDDALSFSIFTTLALLITPIVHDSYHILLLVPLFDLWCRPGRSWLRLVVLGAVLLICLQRFWRPLTQIVVSPWLMLFGLLGTLLVWAALLFWRSPQDEDGALSER